jgi:hypothetical protein
MFDIPIAHSLDRITGSPTPTIRTGDSSADRIIPFGRHSISITTSMTPLLAHWRTRSSVTEAIQAAINSGLASAARELANPVLSTTISNVSLGPNTSPCTKPTTQSVYHQRKLDDCEKTLMGLTPEPRACSAPPTVPDYPIDSQKLQTSTESPITWRPAHASDQQTLVVDSSCLHDRCIHCLRSGSLSYRRLRPPKCLFRSLLVIHQPPTPFRKHHQRLLHPVLGICCCPRVPAKKVCL